MAARSAPVAQLLLATLGSLLLGACGGFSPIVDGATDGGADALVSPFTVVQGLPEGETLDSLWGADADHVFAVGSNAVRYLYFDGSWHRFQTEKGRDYFAVWGSSATDVYAVGATQNGGNGLVVHFDGSSWTDEYSAPTALYGVWGDGSVVLAVGAKGMIYGKKVNTTDWGVRQSPPLPANPAVPITPDSPILWGIAGNSFGDFAMPADQDRVFHQEGMTGIANLDPAVDISLVFQSVWAPPNTSNNFFFGTNYFGVVWLTAAPPTGLDMIADEMYTVFRDSSPAGADKLFLRGIWGTASNVLFAGDQGRIYRYDAGANAVTPVPSPTTGALWAVWGSSPDDVWIVGERELILHGRLP